MIEIHKYFIVDDTFSIGKSFFFILFFQLSTFNVFFLGIVTKHKRNVNNLVITMARSNDIAFDGIGNKMFIARWYLKKNERKTTVILQGYFPISKNKYSPVGKGFSLFCINIIKKKSYNRHC